MSNLKSQVSAMIGSAMMVGAPSLNTSGISVNVPVEFVSNAALATTDFSSVNTSSTLLARKAEVEWTAASGIRFKQLIRKKALGDITIAELVEFKALSELRSKTLFPLTADQILLQRRQRNAAARLLEVVKEYAESHNLSGPEKVS
jgi:hypothetical protein